MVFVFYMGGGGGGDNVLTDAAATFDVFMSSAMYVMTAGQIGA